MTVLDGENETELTFSNTDLLERHVIQRHPGWTAYPGPADLEKYERTNRERAIY